MTPTGYDDKYIPADEATTDQSALGYLETAAHIMRDRGKDYDKADQGERSMGATVACFNTITGNNITEAEGWLLLQILKDVRQWQQPGRYHEDSAVDCIAYAALKAEALADA